ncbi:hypothetical protein ACFYS7_27270 [Streptomyces avermitilis]|uniref:hypothetical protein n=1 Tax=Streptomyces avermitilis TaxID=33903 RepID=UPI00368F1993
MLAIQRRLPFFSLTRDRRISSIEAGRYAVCADRARTLARNYSCADAPYVYALTTMTGGRKRGWWEEHRDTLPSNLLELAEVEYRATSLA